MSFFEKSLIVHEQLHGKISINSKIPIGSRDDLSVAYTPGVAAPCEKIATDPESAYTLTIKGNSVAVLTDGSAVLGLGHWSSSCTTCYGRKSFALQRVRKN